VRRGLCVGVVSYEYEYELYSAAASIEDMVALQR
jgi:hypothetical protein